MQALNVDAGEEQLLEIRSLGEDSNIFKINFLFFQTSDLYKRVLNEREFQILKPDNLKIQHHNI